MLVTKQLTSIIQKQKVRARRVFKNVKQLVLTIVCAELFRVAVLVTIGIVGLLVKRFPVVRAAIKTVSRVV